MPPLAVAGLVSALALLIALHLRLHALPRALQAIVRKDRAQDGGGLLDAMKEAVALRSGQALIAIQTYQDQLAQHVRAQAGEAETRAHDAERRAADTAAAIEAASGVVRELRAAVEAASAVTRELDAVLARAPRSAPRDDASEFDDEEEMTKVAKRPEINPRTPAAPGPGPAEKAPIAKPAPAAATPLPVPSPPPSRERPTPRAITPPGSAPVLRPEPGIVAANLGPRPDSTRSRHRTPAQRVVTTGEPAKPPARTVGTAPTMPSMPSIREPSHPAPRVHIAERPSPGSRMPPPRSGAS